MKILLIILQVNLSLAPVAAFAARGSLDQLQSLSKSALPRATVFDGRRGSLNPDVLQALRQAAHDQAQIWGDTILEGDVEMTGPVRLDFAQALSAGGRIVGYRIVFSASAASPEGPGRISEAAWVHADLKNVIADETHPATFQVNRR